MLVPRLKTRLHALGVIACVLAVALLAMAQIAVNEPPVAPHSILVFPSRSFISASGYAIDDVVRVSVIHQSGATVNSVDIVPQDDPDTPGFDGIVEVNHPG